MDYAGFWRRLAAWLLDFVILQIAFIAIGLAIGVVVGIFMAVRGQTEIPNFKESPWINLLGVLVAWFYFAGFESSSYQATPGKMALGIQVTDLHGRRISFARATGRHFAKILSALLLLIGFLMIAFTREKQGLHDIIAGCLVLKKKRRLRATALIPGSLESEPWRRYAAHVTEPCQASDSLLLSHARFQFLFNDDKHATRVLAAVPEPLRMLLPAPSGEGYTPAEAAPDVAGRYLVWFENVCLTRPTARQLMNHVVDQGGAIYEVVLQ